MTCLSQFAELILTLHILSFNDSIFAQMSGVSVGTKMGPSYACLFMGYLEHQIQQQYTKPMPEFYTRYIDDGIGAISLPMDTLMELINFIQNFHTAIKFTFEISTEPVTFFDKKRSLKNGRIAATVDYKSTDSHACLDYR